ncbi:MAG: hypothetical protein IKV13_08050, partial [Akkermansia sp.]|nr:hypothetical protein [Akkermansia sp.]
MKKRMLTGLYTGFCLAWAGVIACVVLHEDVGGRWPFSNERLSFVHGCCGDNDIQACGLNDIFAFGKNDITLWATIFTLRVNGGALEENSPTPILPAQRACKASCALCRAQMEEEWVSSPAAGASGELISPGGDRSSASQREFRSCAAREVPAAGL